MKHIDSMDPDYLDKEKLEQIKKMLDEETFSEESGRSVVQYGVHYNYMGSNSKSSIKTIPPILQEIVDDLNQNSDCKLNSILVNKFEGRNSYLPEHSDDEFSINPNSNIFTVTVGAKRTVIFKDTFAGTEHSIEATPGSIYSMSKCSQSVYRHRIDKDPDFTDKVRYSITIRCVHWTHFNSTVMVGDSNTRPMKFGTGRGTIGESTPGKRVESIHVGDIPVQECAPYKNIVLVVGTNDLKKNSVSSNDDIHELVTLYRDKIQQIRQLNKKSNIHIVPVIPSKSNETNKKIMYFNHLVCNELIQHFPKLFIVKGTQDFADPYSAQLADRYSKKPDPCGLHLNDKGIAKLVSLIKVSIFEAKIVGNKVHNSRLFSSVVDEGPPNPRHR